MRKRRRRKRRGRCFCPLCKLERAELEISHLTRVNAVLTAAITIADAAPEVSQQIRRLIENTATADVGTPCYDAFLEAKSLVCEDYRAYMQYVREANEAKQTRKKRRRK